MKSQRIPAFHVVSMRYRGSTLAEGCECWTDAFANSMVCDAAGVIASPAPGFPGKDIKQAVDELAGRVDMIYLHIDQDILDARYVPNHGTVEPNGPNMEQVLTVVDTVMATGKVIAFALVSVYGKGEGAETSIHSGITLLRGALSSWKKHGMPRID